MIKKLNHHLKERGTTGTIKRFKHCLDENGLKYSFKQIFKPIESGPPPIIPIQQNIIPQEIISPAIPLDHTQHALFPDHTIVIFAGVPFDDVGGGQRPAQFARVLLTQGKKVIYVYAYKKYDFALNKHIDSNIVVPNLEHIFLDDITPDGLSEKLRTFSSVIFELPHKKFLPFAKKCWAIGVTTVFDLIDEWDTSLGGDWYSVEVMQQFVDNCTTVCGSAKLLRDKLVTMGRKDALYVPNAANEEIFDLYKKFSILPQGYKEDDTKRCLYFGSLYGEWFGWDYLTTAAERNPDTSFYLIGDYNQKRILPANIYFLGAKNIDELPAYLYFADAALLPFIPGKISDAVSPIKIFEYLFMAKPVIATHVPEVKDYPNVYIGNTPEEYAARVQQATENEKDNIEAIETFITTNSWASRLQTLLPQNESKKISAIILIRNNEKIIRRCLQSLIYHASGYLKEIIVVDNSSTDNGPSIVRKEFSEVILLQNSRNGCSSGRNLGIKKATGEYIAFFDSDQWFTSGASFEEAVQILKTYPFIGATGWAAGWIDRGSENYGGMIMDYLPKRGMLTNSQFRTDIGYLGTGGFFIKARVLQRTDLFDEFYDPTAFEDTDLCFQIADIGYKLGYRNFGGIKHQPHQTTNASAETDKYLKLFRRNADYFKRKWGNKDQLFTSYKGY
jgi:GT2 family glycosyltransferase/glycosyltransferase involved in cell wall biosynthesis